MAGGAANGTAPAPRRQYARTAGGGVAILPPAAAPSELAARVATAPAQADKDAVATAAILAAMAAFLAAMRKRDQRWLAEHLPVGISREKVTPDDIARVIAEELQREDAFAEASIGRLRKATLGALRAGDEGERDRLIQSAIDREKLYARQHAEAMAARSFAAVGRVSLKVDSPQGAFWRLDPHVKEHTRGCLLMGGKFWPWVVLDRVHPPRHAGCPCRLVSYGEAIAEGLMTAQDVPNVADAVKASAGVLMESTDVQALMDELALRERLIESGMVTSEALAVIPLGVS